jgi:hypothetical protein
MNSMTIIMIAVISIGVLYLLADKLILPFWRGQKNKKKAATWIYCHFFHPTGGFPQHLMCEPVGAFHIRPPKEHLPYFGKKPSNPSNDTPLYCLIGAVTIGMDANGKAIEREMRMTIRDLWPPDAKTDIEKVIVEEAYFIIGQEQALNPFNKFLPVNTARANIAIREEKSIQYVANIMNKSVEVLEKLDSFLRNVSKSLTLILIGVIASVGIGLMGAIIAFLAYRAAKAG